MPIARRELLLRASALTGAAVALLGAAAPAEAATPTDANGLNPLSILDQTAALQAAIERAAAKGEVLRLHMGLAPRQARERAIALLDEVGIPDPAYKVNAFPSQMSGGQQQRVMIAMAIACNPEVLIADEPTTALDVTIQAQILELLLSLQRARGMGVILVTHNMDVVAQSARSVLVMYAGQIVEERSSATLFQAPQHPYTAALLAARPAQAASGRLATIPGAPPGLLHRSAGCLFGPRCPYATDRSRTIRPDLRDWKGGKVRCHYPLGDPDRHARIAADRRVGTEVAP